MQNTLDHCLKKPDIFLDKKKMVLKRKMRIFIYLSFEMLTLIRQVWIKEQKEQVHSSDLQ